MFTSFAYTFLAQALEVSVHFFDPTAIYDLPVGNWTADIYIDDLTTPTVETRDEILVRALYASYDNLVQNLGSNMTNWEWGLHHIIYIEHLAGLTHIGGEGHRGNRYTVKAVEKVIKNCNVSYKVHLT